MSIDTSGNMILGEEVENITLPCDDIFDLGEWADDNGMRTMSPYYDSPPDHWTIGFKIKDVPVDKMDDKWMADIKAKAQKFEELTGTKAKLIGTVNVF